MWEMKIKYWSEIQKGRYHLEDTHTDGRIIFKEMDGWVHVDWPNSQDRDYG
jgi:hypothetical protein